MKSMKFSGILVLAAMYGCATFTPAPSHERSEKGRIDTGNLAARNVRQILDAYG